MKQTLIVALIIIAGAAAAFVGLRNEAHITTNVREILPPWIGYAFAGEGEHSMSRKVEAGKTFAEVAESFGIGYEDMLAMVDAAKDTYNLEKIVEGKEVSVIVNETKRAEIEGVINSSLFAAITAAGGDERVALALAEAFGWQIDFVTDIRDGGSFKAIYEKRFLNGNYVAPGNILAAEFVNDDRITEGIYFVTSDGKGGHYGPDGLSLEKIFLRSPLSYKYISSGFSYNRLSPVTRTNWGPDRKSV